MIPGVRSDFMAIPDTPSDQNYVDEWLSKKKEEINQKYRNTLTAPLRSMMNVFSRKAAVEMITQYGNESGNT
ncbi:hypothetical protein HOLleu_11965 [Holothuria leucospilota]|uniref:Uncharacterized protein n=1 Tax=Holothuria leucospilota TaxID=206669 RepID=A0A9Q1C9H8_HOLLE|nr:hypothetical protein HOLleu_11965 [Holothuria leucospilota]